MKEVTLRADSVSDIFQLLTAIRERVLYLRGKDLLFSAKVCERLEEQLREQIDAMVEPPRTATILAKDIDQAGLFRAKAQAYLFGAYNQRGITWWGNSLSAALATISQEPTLGCLNLSFEEGRALLEEVLGYELA